MSPNNYLTPLLEGTVALAVSATSVVGVESACAYAAADNTVGTPTFHARGKELAA